MSTFNKIRRPPELEPWPDFKPVRDALIERPELLATLDRTEGWFESVWQAITLETPYAEQYTYENSLTVTTAASGTYYTLGNSSDGSNKALTAGLVNRMILPRTVASTGIVTIDGGYRFLIGAGGAGVYMVSWNISFSSDTPNTVWHGDVFSGPTGSIAENQNIAWQRDIATANSIGSASACGYLSLSENDYVMCKIKSDNNGAVMAVDHTNFNIHLIRWL